MTDNFNPDSMNIEPDEPTTAEQDSDDAAKANLDAHLEQASAHREPGESLKGYMAPHAATIVGDID
jgi:hypothetical protein